MSMDVPSHTEHLDFLAQSFTPSSVQIESHSMVLIFTALQVNTIGTKHMTQKIEEETST